MKYVVDNHGYKALFDESNGYTLRMGEDGKDPFCVYCTIKIPKVAEDNPKSCMRIFPIIADAFGISLRPR